MTESSALRRPVAVFLSRFPLITETFILREIIEMERQGQPVLLVPMLREHPKVVHREVMPWLERAIFTPYFSLPIALANLRAMFVTPGRYFGTLARLKLGMLRSPSFFLRSIAIFPKSVFLASVLRKKSIRHIHAHFATHPATMAWIISSLEPSISYSFTAHAHDIFVNRTMLEAKIRNASAVRVISAFNRSYLGALYRRIPATKYEVIHVGIRPSDYSSEAPPDTDPVRFLCVAAFKPYKGLRVLVEACKLLDSQGVNFVCDIVGEGPLRRQIEHLIERLHVDERVRLLGARPQHEVAEMVKNCSIFVLPSVVAPDGQMEGIPVALMEAMAASRPVIASALSGIPELIDSEKNGLLVDPNHPEHLADAMRKLLGDRSLRQRLGEGAHAKVTAEFDLRGCTNELVAFLDRFNPPLEDVTLPSTFAGRRAGVTETHTTRDAIVARVLLDGGEGEIIVKNHRSREGESRPPAERARFEHEILERLWDEAEGEYSVPRPLTVEGSSVVMSVAAGERLDAILRRERTHAPSPVLEESIRKAGEWLRWFHARTRSAAEVRAETTPMTLIHGDYWPGNIFVSDDRVTVVDFEGVRGGDPLDDVAYFLVHLELFFPMLLHDRFGKLRDIFLAAWGAGKEIDRDALAAKISTHARALRDSLRKPSLLAVIQRRQLARHLVRRAS